MDGRGASNAKILVVEDDPAFRRVLCLLLGDRYDVREAGSAGEARAACPPELDVLLIDLNIAGVEGVGLAKELRRTATQARVVYMSGTPHADTNVKSEDTLLAKPFTREQLLDAVGEALAEG